MQDSLLVVVYGVKTLAEIAEGKVVSKYNTKLAKFPVTVIESCRQRLKFLPRKSWQQLELLHLDKGLSYGQKPLEGRSGGYITANGSNLGKEIEREEQMFIE